mmetsp:Transcript_8955/g.9472  ORF Transcript_8955/g.9472 Transcript_8955/m.9472 type:complete len:183 (-) Transcript_8955:140-688(-)
MESLIISQKTLQELTTLDQLQTEELSKICKYFLQAILRGQISNELESDYESQLSAITTILLEAARVRANYEQLKALFHEHSLSNEVSELLCELYNQHQENIINHLENTGISSPIIVDIDWRLDYSIRSKHGGRNNIPMYFVTLKVKDRGLLRDIDMIASLEEIQDLLGSVRDAVKQVERDEF